LRSLLERFKKSHGFTEEGISWYTFRHTFATMMLKKKKARLVADALGHAKASTTIDNYDSTFDEDHDEFADTIDEMFSDFIGNKNPSGSNSLTDKQYLQNPYCKSYCKADNFRRF